MCNCRKKKSPPRCPLAKPSLHWPSFYRASIQINILLLTKPTGFDIYCYSVSVLIVHHIRATTVTLLVWSMRVREGGSCLILFCSWYTRGLLTLKGIRGCNDSRFGSRTVRLTNPERKEEEEVKMWGNALSNVICFPIWVSVIAVLLLIPPCSVFKVVFLHAVCL